MNHDPAISRTQHRARKRFGQNFLHDPAVIDRIVSVIAPQRSDRLVEIGPGLGALTAPLLDRVDELHAVELDRDLVAHLQRRFTAATGLVIHQADALRFDFSSLVTDNRRLRIVGNLPYNISTPLLFHLLALGPLVQDMHFMLQKEVVDRLVAAPSSKSYGRLTLTLQVRAKAEMIFEVGPGAFSPAPKVRSAIVRITPQAPAFKIGNLRRYDQLVTAAFSQRRKRIANALRGLVESQQFQAAGINPDLRAEQLSAEDFARIAESSNGQPE